MKIVYAVLLSFLPACAFATPVPEDKYLVASCHATPEVHSGDDYPGKAAIIPSNKLVLPAGKSIYAPGQKIYISGRVLDEKCVPVSDAIIDIWQADPDGKYVKSSIGQRVSPFPHFAGSGRATTDNLGRFNFVTLFPGTYGARAPHIHFQVMHKNFPKLQTEMFFLDDRRNATDQVLQKLDPDQRGHLTAKVWQRNPNDAELGLGGSWDIVLRGKNPYRHF